MRAGKRYDRHSSRVPNYDADGRWTGPDVWTTGNGDPSFARVMADQLGYNWRRGR